MFQKKNEHIWVWEGWNNVLILPLISSLHHMPVKPTEYQKAF